MAYGWLGTYAYRRRIYVDSTNIDSSLTYFPIPIVLGTSVGQSNQDVSDIFDEVGAEYLKIAVTGPDRSVQLYCDVELWDNGNENAVIHVSNSHLLINSAGDTEIYIYFDSAQDDNTAYVGLSGSVAAQPAWDSNFEAVYHMNQDPSGGAGAMLDSTSNNNNGTSSGTMTTADLVAGGIGKAIDFEGNDDLINCGSGASLDDLTTMTLEIFTNLDAQNGTNTTSQFLNKTNWSLSTDPSNSQNLFSLNFDEANGEWSFPQTALSSYLHLAVTFSNAEDTDGFYLSDPCDGLIGTDLLTCQENFAWYIDGDDPCVDLIGADLENCQSSLFPWYYANQTPWDYGNLTGLSEQESRELYYWVHDRIRQDPVVYFNGVSQTVEMTANPEGTYSSDAASDLIIANNAAQNSGIDGKDGEVRISSSIRSAAWIKATSYGLSDDLLTFEATVEIDDIIPSDEPCELDCTNPYDNPVTPVDPFGDCGDTCGTAGSILIKSIIIDCADCYGPLEAFAYLGIRSIQPYYLDSLVSFILTEGYATTNFDASRHPRHAFGNNLTGTDANNTWMSTRNTVTNQRIIGVLQTPITADAIVINNYHDSGASTIRGAKNIKIYITDEAYTDTIYEASINGNSRLVYDGLLAEHVANDIADPQTFAIPAYDPYDNDCASFNETNPYDNNCA